MHQASGNLLECGLFSADVIFFQEVEPISLSSALHQPRLDDFQSVGNSIRVVCLSALEVNVLSVYAYSLNLIWNGIRRSYGHCLAVKELPDRTTSWISNTKPASLLNASAHTTQKKADSSEWKFCAGWSVEPLHISEAEWRLLLGAVLSWESLHRAHFPASPSLCPLEDLLHHIQSLLFLLMHMPFQINLLTPSQIYLIWSSWCQMRFWFSISRGSIKFLSWTQHLNRHIEVQIHFLERILL